MRLADEREREKEERMNGKRKGDFVNAYLAGVLSVWSN
jgi:hypothetical protein